MHTVRALSPLQQDTLEAFFAREQGFFLTGGAALIAFYLHHRETEDLDLFTTADDAFERGPFVLRHVASLLGASVEVVQDAPDFKRFTLGRGDEVVVVDLVRDRVPQLHPDKPLRGAVRVDPVDEIVVNKLTAVVGRMEERDLVDLYLLERAGYPVERHLDAALAKDGGCTPATLAWLLSGIQLPDHRALPAGVPPAELREWIADLVVRLRRAAVPPT